MTTLCAQCDTIVLNYKLGPLSYIKDGEYISLRDYVIIREYAGLSELNSAAALAGCAFCKLIWRLVCIKHDENIRKGKEKEQFSRIVCFFSQIGSGLMVKSEAGCISRYEYLNDIYTEAGSDQYQIFTLHTCLN